MGAFESMGLKLTTPKRIKAYETAGFWGEGCLHDFLVRNAQASPKSLSLIDPPDRERFAQGKPVALNTEQTLFTVERLGQVFDQLGLEAGDLIAIQLPQIVEAPLAILAAAKAGLMVCLLPPHWGRREMQRALGPVAPRAILSWAAPASQGQSRLEALREVASKLPSVRFLLAIGRDVPDGIVPLGAFAFDAQQRAKHSGISPTQATGKPDQSDANDVVVVTWPTTKADGTWAMARSHNELKATGLGIVDAADMGDGARIVCPFALSTYASISSFFITWLLCGGCLVFHRAFDLDRYISTLAEAKTAFSAIPARLEAPVLAALAAQGAEAPLPQCLGVLRDLAVASSHASMPQISSLPVLDILNLNDLALHAELRTATGQVSVPNIRNSPTSTRPPPLLETHLAPPRADDAPGVAELFVRSPMTPSAAVGGKGGLFSVLQDADGFVAAGLVARKSKRRFIPSAISKPDHAIHGGLNLDLAELKALYAAWPSAACTKIDLVADEIMGFRLKATLQIAPNCAKTTADDFRAFLRSEGAGDHMLPDIIHMVDETKIPQPAAAARTPAQIDVAQEQAVSHKATGV